MESDQPTMLVDEEIEIDKPEEHESIPEVSTQLVHLTETEQQ
jgi:hypothetical protein